MDERPVAEVAFRRALHCQHGRVFDFTDGAEHFAADSVD
jgi:hypothetical protein